MANDFITPSQFEQGVQEIKNYIDNRLPNQKVLLTISASEIEEVVNNEIPLFELDNIIDLNKKYMIRIGDDYAFGYLLENQIEENELESQSQHIISFYNINFWEVIIYSGFNFNGELDESKMVISYDAFNSFNLSDMDIIEISNPILNKYLQNDVNIYNSLTIGTRNGSIGEYSFCSGELNIASGYDSHAEGSYTTASGDYSHAEGAETAAIGNGSHAEGSHTTSSGYYSHAEGYHTTASGDYSHVQGIFNIEDTENKYCHIVGNGNDRNRSNAHTLDWDGNAWYSGKLSQNGIPTSYNDLTTKEYVDTKNTELKEYVDYKYANIADGVILRDQTTGIEYVLQIDNGTLITKLIPSDIQVVVNSLPEFIDGGVIDSNNINISMNAVYSDDNIEEITDTDSISYYPTTITSDVTEITATYELYGKKYVKTIPITVQEFDPTVVLVDFEYTDNGDGTYTLTGWKETYNGEPSTELIIPDNTHIIL